MPSVLGDYEALRPLLTYEISLFLGVGIIVLYGWSRFDRPVPALKGSPSSLFQALSPKAMGPGSVRGSSYLAYFAFLVLIYLALCVFGTPAVFTLLGLPLPESASGSGLPEAIGLDAQVTGWDGPRTLVENSAIIYGNLAPLTIALVLVGIGPSLKWSGALEDRLRLVALGVAGLPDRILQRARSLQTKPFLEETAAATSAAADAHSTEPSSPSDILQYIDRIGKRVGTNVFLQSFRDDLIRVLTFHAWFTRGGLKFVHRSVDAELVERENDVAGRTDRLLFDLESLPSQPSQDSAPLATGMDKMARERQLTDIAQRLGALADDVCLLLALHENHGLDLWSADAEDPSQITAQSAAVKLLGGKADRSENPAFRAEIWLNLTVVAVATAFFTSLFLPDPALSASGHSAFPNWTTAFLAALSALFNIAPALLVALSVDRATYARATGGAGPSPAYGWVACFCTAWAASLVSLVTLNFLLLIWNPDIGLVKVLVDKWRILPAAIESEWLLAAAGGLLAVCVVRAIRMSRSGALEGQGSVGDALIGPGFWLIARGGVLFAAPFAADRYLQIDASAGRVGAELRDPIALLAGADPQLTYAVGIGLAIGFMSMLSVVTTLLGRFADGGTAVEKRLGARRQNKAALASVALLVLAAAYPSPSRAEPLICGENEPRDTVRIGVRTDAPPFASYNEDHQSFGGFLYDLCVAAVQNARLNFCLRKLTPDDRQRVIEGRAEPESQFDLLCDPTTLTIKRMRALNARLDRTRRADPPAPRNGVEAHWRFTQVVFLGSSGAVENEGAEPNAAATADEPKDCRTGRLNLVAYAKPIVESEGDGVSEVYNLVYVRGTTADETIGRRLDDLADLLHRHRQVCAEGYDTYFDAAEKFCGGAARWIVGDLDILRAVFARWSEKNDGKVCKRTKLVSAAKEPYALLVSDGIPGLPDLFVQELYELFSDGVDKDRLSSAKGALRTHIGPDARLSGLLETLFDINDVPVGVAEQVDKREEDPSSTPSESRPGGAKVSQAATVGRRD